MRFALAVLAAFIGACATPPEPVGPGIDAPPSVMTADQADRNTIATCLDFETEDDRVCIGLVSGACGEAMGEGASSTGGIVMCVAREERAWAALLTEAVAELRQRESASQIALLGAALAQGEQWTSARCAFQASFYEGGSLARVLGAQCRRDTIAERAIDLNQRLIDYDQ